jgi:hypothetical protein
MRQQISCDNPSPLPIIVLMLDIFNPCNGTAFDICATSSLGVYTEAGDQHLVTQDAIATAPTAERVTLSWYP